MAWGYYMQGNKQLVEVDQLGSKLSLEIGCAVHYPAFGKNLFECKCGVIFPLYLVRSMDWDLLREKHCSERRLVDT